MYSRTHNLIIGFHGCDKAVRDAIVSGQIAMQKSENPYDWLGHGYYFWENDPYRAMEFAKEKYQKQIIQEPAVLGATIDLGYCLDLQNLHCLQEVKDSYHVLKEIHQQKQIPLPVNKHEKKLHNLDCAVIETMHLCNADKNEPPYDSVRGMFREGGELYIGSGFYEKDHVQICVRNPNCIKGFFIPCANDAKYPIL